MEKKWYIITTISGKEDKVVEALKNRIISEKMDNDFERFAVMSVPSISPKELEKKLQNLPFKIRQKNLYPGYIFAKMNMTNEAWFMVRNTQDVTGLVGSSGERTKPTPVSETEMKKMFNEVEKQKRDFEAGKITTPFVAGAVVEIIDGPAKGQVGKIIENDDLTQISIVEIVMFERKTPTEIEHKNLRIKN